MPRAWHRAWPFAACRVCRMGDGCRQAVHSRVPSALMGREQRPQIPGGLYHINTRGNRRAPIYLDDEDRVHFLQLLAKVIVRAKWSCHAYCLMTNHYHVLVETREPTISAGMELLNGQFARGFNAKYGLRGHV